MEKVKLGKIGSLKELKNKAYEYFIKIGVIDTADFVFIVDESESLRNDLEALKNEQLTSIVFFRRDDLPKDIKINTMYVPGVGYVHFE